MTIKDIFNEIYENSSWGYKSGTGSDPEFSKVWIEVVNSILKQDDILTVIDVGCGDWRLGRCLNLDGKVYTGIDVSSTILDETKLNAKENINFICGDFEELDIDDVDLILIKDVLQHLTNDSVINIINKIMSKSKYALICDDISDINNNDINAGDHRYLDLSKEPFNFKFKKLDEFNGKSINLYIRNGE